jgi:hypothetical protein
MWYFANPSTGAVTSAMLAGRLGAIDTPAQGNLIPDGVFLCKDNGCFGKGYPGDEAFLDWLARSAAEAERCAFAVAPDVVGDAVATLERSRPFLNKIRGIGFRVAFVAQNGLEDLTVPWDDFDALFVGGDTTWKLSPVAASLVAEANRRGRWTHMGRVNSWVRFWYARLISCDSVDGTYLTRGPDINLPKVLRWLDRIESGYLADWLAGANPREIAEAVAVVRQRALANEQRSTFDERQMDLFDLDVVGGAA